MHLSSNTLSNDAASYPAYETTSLKAAVKVTQILHLIYYANFYFGILTRNSFLMLPQHLQDEEKKESSALCQQDPPLHGN